MSPRYEVIKRLCLPSGAALPSLLSPLALGKPRSEQPCGQAPWGGTEAPHRPPQPQPQDNLGSWALPQPPSHAIILEADPVPPGRTSGSRPADNLTGFCPPRQAIWQRPS